MKEIADMPSTFSRSLQHIRIQALGVDVMARVHAKLLRNQEMLMHVT
jgi:hypothetical protein